MRGFVIIAALVGCGEVVQQQPDLRKELGNACTSGADCLTGNCADGVCCNAACDGTCEACVNAKTGVDDGVCAPIPANTDPDAECPSGCTAEGAVHATCMGSVAACNTQTTACGYYACDAQSITCASTCTDNTSCSATGFCNAAGVCAKRLRVAIEASPDACTRNNSLPVVKAALEARGHTATIVDGTMIDEEAEIAQYDVILTGGLGNPGCQPDDRAAYDAVLMPWVLNGGGLVASGWVFFLRPPTNFTALLPTYDPNYSYLSGAQSVTMVDPHPIVTGIGPFTSSGDNISYATQPKSGSTYLLQAGGQYIANAWTQGAGRVVFDGLLHLEDYATYHNAPLIDGTNPAALEILMRSVEWAGSSL